VSRADGQYAAAMSPQRRTALVSVGAAVALMVVKLVAGLASGSLGLVSEALHSGTDLVAALLTFFAIGVAVRPADTSHPYGHGKAEHLAALAEAGVLLLVSVAVGALAVARLTGRIEIETTTAWWVFAAIAVVIAIDVSRTLVSFRAARKHSSPALASNALHFGSDLAGTLAVLVGLLAVRGGWPDGDSVAALFVAFLVVTAAARLIRRNVDVLMDRAPVETVRIASEAIATLDPPVEVRRLRLRQAAGRTFTDVVIGVSPGAAVGQGHAVADRVEEAVHGVLPDSDVVVHVEPAAAETALRERVHESAMSVAQVREIHNLSVIELPDGFHVSLHLKLPGDLSLEEAHAIAEQVEAAIVEGVPEIVDVQSHLEPLAEPAAGRVADDDPAAVERLVRDVTGSPPRALRLLRTDEGVVVLLTLALDPAERLAAAHATASSVEERIREAVPGVVEVIVHTEP
jgi:cation diffusion facilitator family transporter